MKSFFAPIPYWPLNTNSVFEVDLARWRPWFEFCSWQWRKNVMLSPPPSVKCWRFHCMWIDSASFWPSRVYVSIYNVYNVYILYTMSVKYDVSTENQSVMIYYVWHNNNDSMILCFLVLYRPEERSGEDVDIIMARLKRVKAFEKFHPTMLQQICLCGFYECLEKGITCRSYHTFRHSKHIHRLQHMQPCSL